MKTKLNKTQLEAVESNKGPVLIFAGAGSGKTKVLTEKIHYLIEKEKLNPKNILSVTFTNKAAKEMKTRVKSLLKTKNLGVNILFFSCSQFHNTILLQFFLGYTVWTCPSIFVVSLGV